jgi:hypothetical protein
MNYEDFLESKRIKVEPSGFDVPASEIHPALCQPGFEFQRDVVLWGLKKGRATCFSGTGTGKTIVQAEWARHVHKHTGANVLILSPLAVAKQTAQLAKEKLDLEITVCRTQADIKPGINITNYEMLEHFDVGAFVGVVLDESSILKSFGGATKIELIKKFKDTEYSFYWRGAD